jgi:hypothetical protein
LATDMSQLRRLSQATHYFAHHPASAIMVAGRVVLLFRLRGVAQSGSAPALGSAGAHPHRLT